MDDKLLGYLAFLYGAERAPALQARLNGIIESFHRQHPALAERSGARVTEKDAILITYGDMVRGPAAPLASLADFLIKHLAGLVSGVHFLPFFPYSSDDGFSVIDYWSVDPALGSWEEVARAGRHFRLMFDAVINHISAKSDWFKRFVQGDPEFEGFFTLVDPEADLSQVFRPRTLPLLTKIETAAGDKHVWTTFSDDQIDLNYANPEVLLKIVELLLFYVAQGADFIRLDAIAFMWKELGTNCLHLPQTHHAIKLMRAVLQEVAPSVALITETNVPHQENVSYFGDGHDEAQLVYNFSLPPLTLHAFHTGNAEMLSSWARMLTLPSDEVTFFNFNASHDGIGLTPVQGILDEEEVNKIAARVEALGGYVSYRNSPNGRRAAYELNINFLDALADPEKEDEPVAWVARRFLASQAIMLSLRGVPGIYFHSLFGSRGWPEGVKETGHNRSINRQKLQRDPLEQELADGRSLRHHVFDGYAKLIRHRTAHPAFHPNGAQEILAVHEAIFAVRRGSLDGEESVLCLHNVSAKAVQVTVEQAAPISNLLDGRQFGATGGRLTLTLAPYEVLWLAH